MHKIINYCLRRALNEILKWMKHTNQNQDVARLKTSGVMK